jgi:hypothetical protein
MSITWIASPKRRAHTGPNDKIQAGSSQIQSEICPRQSPTRTLIIRSHIFCPFYPLPQYFCYIQEKMANSVGRDVSGVTIATCPSVRLPRNAESILLLLAWDAASNTTVMFLHASPVYRSCCSYIFTYDCARHGTHSIGNQTDGNLPQNSIVCYGTYSWLI